MKNTIELWDRLMYFNFGEMEEYFIRLFFMWSRLMLEIFKEVRFWHFVMMVFMNSTELIPWLFERFRSSRSVLIALKST